MTKFCKGCQTEKNISEFHKDNRNKKDGARSACKPCAETVKKAWRLKNVEHIKRYGRERSKLFPWLAAYKNALARCRNPKHKSYYLYGGRGIKLLMTPNDFKQLWFRDKAHLMERPSIDRIDKDGSYTIENCRYLELTENINRARRRRKL